MNGKGSGRRKEAIRGNYAEGYDRIWGNPRSRTLSFVAAILKVWGEVVIGGDSEIYIIAGSRRR